MAESESRGRKLRVQQQVDENGEFILQSTRKRKVEPPVKPNRPKPIKKSKVHKALRKVEKRTGLKLQVKQALPPSLRSTDDDASQTHVTNLGDLREEDILDYINDVRALFKSRRPTSDTAENVGWKIWSNKYKDKFYKFTQTQPEISNTPIDYSNNFHSKYELNIERIKDTLLILETKKTLLEEENIKLGDKALKEKRYNSIKQGLL